LSEWGKILGIQVGKAHVEILELNAPFSEKPLGEHRSGEPEIMGTVSKFRVTTTDDLNMIFGIVSWPTEESDVRWIETIDGLMKYKRLENAGRLSIAPHGPDQVLVQLRAMKYVTPAVANLKQVSLEELSEMLGSSSEKLLRENGALKIDTKAALVGDRSTHKNSLALTCERGNNAIIAVVFTLTRVLTIMHDFGQSEILN
jgi:hypothetical protein